MPVPSKAPCVIGIVAMAALTAAVADARDVNTRRFDGAYNSAAPAHAGAGSIFYGADVAPFPTGHGGGTSSPDFQLVR